MSQFKVEVAVDERAMRVSHRIGKGLRSVVVNKLGGELHVGEGSWPDQPDGHPPAIGEGFVRIVGQGVVLVVHLPPPADVEGGELLQLSQSVEEVSNGGVVIDHCEIDLGRFTLLPDHDCNVNPSSITARLVELHYFWVVGEGHLHSMGGVGLPFKRSVSIGHRYC